MSVQDVIKKSFVEVVQTMQLDLPHIMINTLIALLMGGLIYLIYRKFYTGVVFSHSFAMTLVGMTVLTHMITLAISSNVVISLGMVGALSIVRYRTAVKDPLDLLYLFWAITTGITVGANMYALALITAAIMIIMILIFSRRQHSGRIYIMIVHYNSQCTGDDVIRAIGKRKFFVKSTTLRGEKTEMAVELFFQREDVSFLERIRAVQGVEDATMIQYNGEYHG